jgi:hypothetical protein
MNNPKHRAPLFPKLDQDSRPSRTKAFGRPDSDRSARESIHLAALASFGTLIFQQVGDGVGQVLASLPVLDMLFVMAIILLILA